MAGYTVTVNMPNLKKGEVVNISGLGDFKNGETVEVSQEQADQFRAYHQVITSSPGEETVIELGPTVLQAFQGRSDIEVTASKGAPKASADKKDGDS